MSLIKEWKENVENLGTNEEYNEFWSVYLPKEQSNYEFLLENNDAIVAGTVEKLSSEFGMDNVTFVGFLDGINDSLKNKIDLGDVTTDTEIKLELDFKKLFYNMLDASADWLYNLPQWENVLSIEERTAITKEYKESKIFVNTDSKVGRNDPCPCGSGKKYKKCCINK